MKMTSASQSDTLGVASYLPAAKSNKRRVPRRLRPRPFPLLTVEIKDYCLYGFIWPTPSAQVVFNPLLAFTLGTPVPTFSLWFPGFPLLPAETAAFPKALCLEEDMCGFFLV